MRTPPALRNACSACHWSQSLCRPSRISADVSSSLARPQGRVGTDAASGGMRRASGSA